MPHAPVSSTDALPARLQYVALAEQGRVAASAGLPPVPGIEHTSETITGVDGNLYGSQPSQRRRIFASAASSPLA